MRVLCTIWLRATTRNCRAGAPPAGRGEGQAERSPYIQTPHFDFELGAANVRALAKNKKMSIETAAREARYSFFAKAAKRHRCRTIFLAHHADDFVETFLIKLFRGAGIAGLAAMREISTRRIDDVDLTIVRPFLSVWRKRSTITCANIG